MKGDLVIVFRALLTETAAGVYESAVRVTLAALRVSEASVEVAVEGAGQAGGPVTVQLARRMTMDSLTLLPCLMTFSSNRPPGRRCRLQRR